MTKRLFPMLACLLLAACRGEEDGRPTVGADSNQSPDAAMVNVDPMKEAPLAGSTGPEYAATASAADSFEIQSSRIALQKGQSPAVRRLAQMIIADHRRSASELARAGQQAGIAIASPPQLDMEQQANLIELRQASGAAFDNVYLQQQLAAHRNAFTLVQGYAQAGEIPALRNQAAQAVGPIGRHLEQVRALVTGSTRSGS